MKALIVYASKYGCTEKAVKKLANYIEQDVEMVNLKDKKENLDLIEYDIIAIGGSIYVGQIQKEVKEFCLNNIDIIMQKRLGLFVCAGFEEKVEEQFENSFGQKLIDHAVTKGYFGYEFNFDKMGLLSKMAVKFVAKKNSSESNILDKNIQEFANKLIG